MWPFDALFNRPECAGHDWEETAIEDWSDATVDRQRKISSFKVPQCINITVGRYKRCKRDGCDERKRCGTRTYHTPEISLSTQDEKEKLQYIEEAIELYEGLDDDEDINSYRMKLTDILEENK
jgi:hypothetical protein